MVTLGCSKNIFDSEVLLGHLKAGNIDAAHESPDEDYNIVVINTCGFIESAKQESINTILQYVQAKDEGWVNKVYVTGCLSERYKPELEKEIPEVDAYFGTRELPKLLKTLKADYKKELVGERLLTTPSHSAYFKISEGCDRPCSFCAIPLMRGNHISTPVEQLVDQAGKLAAIGTKELVIIAQDSTYYGLDLYGERKLAYLLQQLATVKGIEWIRLHYAFPSGFPLDVLDVMKNEPKICNYLDIPLQHISTSVLKSMRRGTTSLKTRQLLEKIRKEVPDIAIRTTFMSGYPGEAEADHRELCDFVKESEFDRLGVFTYSHEENTHAFDLKDDVPAKIKQERADEIMAIQRKISGRHNENKVGKEFRVLFDREEGDFLVGRTEYDSPEVDNEVLVNKNSSARVGEFSRVLIDSAEDYDIFGTVIPS